MIDWLTTEHLEYWGMLGMWSVARWESILTVSMGILIALVITIADTMESSRK